MNKLLVSIIVPIYNVEKYLRNCLDSLITQTYRNVEIILVDDGSKDSSGDICDEYALKDSRIIVIHKENGGLSSARNAGLDIATGDFFMFVDSDDHVESQFCEKPLQLALKNNVDIVAFGYFKIRLDGRKVEFKTDNPRIISPSEGVKILLTKTDTIVDYSWNKIYRRSLFDEIRFPQGKVFEDQATTYLLFHKANAIYVSDDVLYDYYFRETSITAGFYKPKSILDRFSILLERLAFLRKNYPDLETVQVKQLIDVAITGFIHLSGKIKYIDNIKKFSSFMDENRDLILSLKNNKNIKLYYFNKYFFYLYCIYYRFRILKS